MAIRSAAEFVQYINLCLAFVPGEAAAYLINPIGVDVLQTAEQYRATHTVLSDLFLGCSFATQLS